MAFSRATIKYKPLRIGFLVREGSVEDLVKAAGINTLLWGGIYNPIIPIKNGDNGNAEQLIKSFSVDTLCAISINDDISVFKETYQFLAPKHHAEDIFYEEWQTKKKISAYLDSKSIADFLWETQFKNRSEGYKSIFSLVEWETIDPLANVFALQFGYFPILPGMDFKWDYKEIFLKGLHAKKEKISLTENVNVDPTKSWSPIRATKTELRGYGGDSIWGYEAIYIGLKDDFNDLVSFWNIRAAGASITYLAKDAWERTLPHAQKLFDFFNTLPNRHPNIEDMLTIYGRLTHEEVKDFSEKIKSKKRFGFTILDERLPYGLNVVDPRYQVFKWQSVNAHTEKDFDRYTVTIELPEKKFLVNENDFDASSQQLGVMVDVYGEYGYPGHTLKLPHIAELNEFYSREVVFDPWELKVNREGFALRIDGRTDSVTLHPINKEILLKKIFDIQGIKAETSQPGLLATKIIEKIGGLEGARVLKIKGVRVLLEEGGPVIFVTRGEAVKTIFNNNFEKHKRLYIESRTSKELDSNQVFDYLLKKDFFRAGLELVCNQCKLKNWLSLKNVDDTWICEYCGSNDAISTHLKNRGDWRFRKSGLFAKDNHQEGAIPVLLTLLTMKRVLDRDHFSYTTALKLNGEKINCESDFCVMEGHRSDALNIAIGECKSEGGSITKQDCENLKGVALKLAEIHFKGEVYITFVKTADSFTSDEITLFKELNKEVRLILFTNKELELYEPYWLANGEIEKDVPEKYPNSMDDLATNSFARYLK